jgi:hypothetical protein
MVCHLSLPRRLRVAMRRVRAGLAYTCRLLRRLLLAVAAPEGTDVRRARDGDDQLSNHEADAWLHDILWR